MATIQWFPGHMSKVEDKYKTKFKICGFCDGSGRYCLPLSSQNPMLTKIVGDKPKLMI